MLFFALGGRLLARGTRMRWWIAIPTELAARVRMPERRDGWAGAAALHGDWPFGQYAWLGYQVGLALVLCQLCWRPLHIFWQISMLVHLSVFSHR